MDLFNQRKQTNFLPYDGEVLYYTNILSLEDAKAFYQNLLSGIAWQQDVVKIFGKQFITARKVAWYGDNDCAYTYSNQTKIALPWTKELLALKNKVEEVSKEHYNACLLNLYHHGDEGMGWHSDDEKSIVPQSAIASLSFGAARKFVFKHKESKESVSLLLENASLLVMKGFTQEKWLHALPKTKKVKDLRINLTFRKMIL
jgi:alkylated DNA repair dioxygenase AlkB